MNNNSHQNRSSTFGFDFLLREKRQDNLFISHVSHQESIRQSIILILSTQKGERPLYPDYGCQLRAFQFRKNNDSLLSRVENEVRTSLNQCEDRIDVLEVKVSRDMKRESRVSILIRYLIKETGAKHSLVYPMSVLD